MPKATSGKALHGVVLKESGLTVDVIRKQILNATEMDKVDPFVAQFIVTSGLRDGDMRDDKVEIRKQSLQATKLKPSQTTMVLDKAVSMAIDMIYRKKIGGDIFAMVSQDNFILDGHHRWAATILAAGKDGKVTGVVAAVPGETLLRLLNLLSKGLFHKKKGQPGTGSINEFTSQNVAAAVKRALERGTGTYSAEQVAKTLAAHFGSVEKGIEQMSHNVTLMTKTVPSWAPDRVQMPVITEKEVPVAANQLSSGLVNWHEPLKVIFDDK